MKTVEVYIEGWVCGECEHENQEPTDIPCAKCQKNYKEDSKDFAFDTINVDFPSVWEICSDCRGEGKTYLGWAAKDQPAFTREDFDYEGPDFYEDYMNGRYDAQCPICKGTGKVKIIDEKAVNRNKRLKVLYAAHMADLKAEYEYQATIAAERRMGA